MLDTTNPEGFEMSAPGGIPSPDRFHQNRAYYDRHVLHILVTTNREMNGLHIWESPFVSLKAKKNLKEAIRHAPNCIQFTATIVSHVMEAKPFHDKNFETATECLERILGCTGYRFDGDDSELEEFLHSLRKCDQGYYSELYGWLTERVKRIDGKPEEKVY